MQENKTVNSCLASNPILNERRLNSSCISFSHTFTSIYPCLSLTLLLLLFLKSFFVVAFRIVWRLFFFLLRFFCCCCWVPSRVDSFCAGFFFCNWSNLYAINKILSRQSFDSSLPCRREKYLYYISSFLFPIRASSFVSFFVSFIV